MGQSSVVQLLEFFLFMKDFAGNFSLIRCHTSSFEVASLGFLSGQHGKFIISDASRRYKMRFYNELYIFPP